jgi:hypothetical protein
MKSVLIAGGKVLDPLGELHHPPVLDILVEDGKIAAVGEEARLRGGAAEVMDASGFLISPGFINAHCHSHDTLLRGLFEQTPLELWGLTAFPFHWSRRSTDEISVRTKLHAAECLRGGMTTIQDMVTLVDFEPEHAEALASAYAASGIEALVAPQFSDLGGAAGMPFVDDLFPPDVQSMLGSDGDPDAVLAQVESLFDRVSAKRLTWQLGPVQPQICSDALLQRVAAIARERQMRIFTHLYETRSEAVLARCRCRRVARGQSRDQSQIDERCRAGPSLPELRRQHRVGMRQQQRQRRPEHFPGHETLRAGLGHAGRGRRRLRRGRGVFSSHHRRSRGDRDVRQHRPDRAGFSRQSRLHRPDRSVVAAAEQRGPTACLRRNGTGRASRLSSGKSRGIRRAVGFHRRTPVM